MTVAASQLVRMQTCRKSINQSSRLTLYPSGDIPLLEKHGYAGW